MPHSVWNRETLLDITVNVVPLFILGFFIALFLLTSPWGSQPFYEAISIGLTLIPLVLLGLLTYIAAKYL